jgi:hypothetical protein
VVGEHLGGVAQLRHPPELRRLRRGHAVDFDLAVRDGGNASQIASQYLTNGSLNDNYYTALTQCPVDAVNAFPPQAKL